MSRNGRSARLKNDEIVEALCAERTIVENLQVAIKNTVTKRPMEEMVKVGHGKPRSAMWIVEECSLSNDFHRGTVATNQEGYSFQDLVFNMMKSFDGFKGAQVSRDWMPFLDPSWCRFRFHPKPVKKYWKALEKIPGTRRIQMVLFMISVVLAVLEEHTDLRVTTSNLFLVFENITTQIASYLIDCFLAFFPRVFADLDRNAVRVDELRRTRSYKDNATSLHFAKLPDISWFINNKTFKAPVVAAPARPPNMPPPPYDRCPPGYLPYPTPVYYLPEEMHPSWCQTYPVAPVPDAYLPVERQIIKVQKNLEPVPLSALIRVQEVSEPTLTVLRPITVHLLAPTPELPFVAIVIVSNQKTRFNLKRKPMESDVIPTEALNEPQAKTFAIPRPLGVPIPSTFPNVYTTTSGYVECDMNQFNNFFFTMKNDAGNGDQVEKFGEPSGTKLSDFFC